MKTENFLNKKSLKDFYYWATITLIFLLLTIIMTWPLVKYFSQGIVGQGLSTDDGPFFMWNFWWVKKAIFSGENPFFTSYMYFPSMANLSLHTLTFTNALFALPLGLFFSEITTLNILQTLSIAIGGVGMVALVNYLTKNKFAGIVSGIIFTFSPYLFSHLLTGHYNLTFIWMIPFLVLFFLKSIAQDKTSNVALFSVLFLAQSYQDLQVAFFAGIILIVIFLFYCIYRPREIFCKLRLRFLLYFIGIFGLGFLLPYVLLVKDFWGNRGIWETYNSGDLLVMFSKNPLNPIWGERIFNRVEGMIGNYRENTISLGYASLAMAILTAISARNFRKKIMFYAIFLVGVIFTLGPNLQIAGNKIEGVALPFYYLSKLPIFSIGVVPTRFVLIAYFALAVLAGYFIDDVWNFIKKTKIRLLFPLIIIIFSIAVLGEYYSGSMSINVLPQSKILGKIADDKRDTNVLVAMPRQRCGFDQMIFDKKMVGGCLGRRINGFYLDRYNDDPGINLIISGDFKKASNSDFSKQAVLQSFKKYNIGYVVADKTIQEQGELKSVRVYLENNLGFKIFAEDSTTVVYKI